MQLKWHFVLVGGLARLRIFFCGNWHFLRDRLLAARGALLFTRENVQLLRALGALGLVLAVPAQERPHTLLFHFLFRVAPLIQLFHRLECVIFLNTFPHKSGIIDIQTIGRSLVRRQRCIVLLSIKHVTQSNKRICTICDNTDTEWQEHERKTQQLEQSYGREDLLWIELVVLEIVRNHCKHASEKRQANSRCHKPGASHGEKKHILQFMLAQSRNQLEEVRLIREQLYDAHA